MLNPSEKDANKEFKTDINGPNIAHCDIVTKKFIDVVERLQNSDFNSEVLKMLNNTHSHSLNTVPQPCSHY